MEQQLNSGASLCSETYRQDEKSVEFDSESLNGNSMSPANSISSKESDSPSGESNRIVIRTGADRIRYTLLFEAFLLLTIAPTVAFFLDKDALDVGMLAVVLSLKAMAMNLVYNYFYDRFDVKRGVTPTKRTGSQRLVHAIGFELSLTLTSLPIVCWWLDLSVLQALIMDASIITFIVLYTYVFTLIYDRIFPVVQPRDSIRTSDCQAP